MAAAHRDAHANSFFKLNREGHFEIRTLIFKTGSIFALKEKYMRIIEPGFISPNRARRRRFQLRFRLVPIVTATHQRSACCSKPAKPHRGSWCEMRRASPG